MTKLLEAAMQAVRHLPPEAQDEIARLIIECAANQGEPEPIAPEDLAAVLEGLVDARAGRFATEQEVVAAFRRFGE